ncbi:MAG: MBL fold metallo-hydrolase [Eubacteriales bacterium]|nr:MBL fold metallo-hydrolase [Eubacteriales bacterium]
MKIRMLIENTACAPELACEHGLSLYIETGKHKVLFDTGQTGAFAENARRLGADLADVDLCVLSHGHYDHGGGLLRFFEENKRAKVYLSEHAFCSCWHGERYIGLDEALRGNDRLVPVREETPLGEGLVLRPGAKIELRSPLSGEGLTVLKNGRQVQDDFRHELYLSIVEGGKHVLISGCSHRGILNIMPHFRPDVLVGGFHFMKEDPHGEGKERLLAAARELMGYDAIYYTCHCTGEEQFALLHSVMGERLRYFSGGMTLEI